MPTVSTWLTAEGTRAEAVRQERLSAYSDFSGAVSSCFLGSVSDPRRATEDCFRSLGLISERVILVTDSDRVDFTASRLTEALAVYQEKASDPAPDDQDRLDRLFSYYEASFARFTKAAKDDMRGSPKSPYVVMTAGLLVVLVAMLGILWRGEMNGDLEALHMGVTAPGPFFARCARRRRAWWAAGPPYAAPVRRPHQVAGKQRQQPRRRPSPDRS